MKKLISLVLALTMCCALAACGGGSEDPGQTLSSDANYVVNIVDALGNPYTGTALIKFMQNGQQQAMQQAKDGVVEKTLPRGAYELELQLPDCEQTFTYNTDAKLTATQTTVDLTVTYQLGEETFELYAGESSSQAHFVFEGCTTVPVVAGQRTYYLYNLTHTGKFQFTVVGDATIGYYGNPHLVQQVSAAEVVDNAFHIDVKDGHLGGQPLVIGLDADADAEVALCITRVGDADWGVEDEPWQTYQPTVELTAYTLPAGAKLVDFDLSAESYTLVKDENGYYHLDTVDGPLVLTYLGVKSKYLDPLQIVSEKSNICKFFWSDPENQTKESFQKKETYNECINAYCEVMDENAGVYPLTDDLMYILQQRGDYYGWWDTTSHSYLFVDENGVVDDTVNPDVAWLFACCYIG